MEKREPAVRSTSGFTKISRRIFLHRAKRCPKGECQEGTSEAPSVTPIATFEIALKSLLLALASRKLFLCHSKCSGQ